MTTSQWLRETREAAGISAEEATFRLRGVLPRSLWVSSDTVRRTEQKDDPNPVLVAALARVCGRSINDAPESVQRDMQAIRALLDPLDLRERQSACTTAVDSDDLAHLRAQRTRRTTANVAAVGKVA